MSLQVRGKLVRFLPLLLVLCLLSLPAWAGHSKEAPAKAGILLVTFGTSVAGADSGYAQVEKLVREAFPGVEVRWAYTSHVIRRKLAAQGRVLDSPAMALARMGEEGFTAVAVQSLHMIPGEEYDDLVSVARAMAGLPECPQKIAVGGPLLVQAADVERVAAAMLESLPRERRKDEAVVFMGHGSPHPAYAFYPAMQLEFWKKDPNAFLATVEGAPSLDEVMAHLKARGLRKAYLVPFMSVAGDHARNDMAGDEPDSWKSILTKAGVTCVPVLRGTAEIDAVNRVWVDHLRQAMEEL
ncbi:MAG: sirohydrochlorin cobaltochelatase [Thermodesulfobacteriota bacterium]